ncbi:hypothetical protein ACFL08_02425 [Patescibacteria group bacterium]
MSGMNSFNIGNGFGFSGIGIDKLEASEYALATIAVDVTGSVDGFEGELLDMLKASVEACKMSPNSDKLMIRVILFSSFFPNGVKEVHGFKPVVEIDMSDYQDLHPNGKTPLYDATFSAVGASNTYAKQLFDEDYSVNSIEIIITDGYDNTSTMTSASVKDEIRKPLQEEWLESRVSILIGINARQYLQYLEAFKDEAGIDQFIDAGDVTPAMLAKLGQFISQSINSQSQALGTGGPSQNIALTI